MSSALRRGRTLDPKAIAAAKKQRENRISYLKSRLASGEITIRERRELRWKWGARLEGNVIVPS